MPVIKYYAVGEYGGQFKRPHYHLIMFNVQIDAILNAWQLGTVHIGYVSGSSVGYTLKYIRKRSYIDVMKAMIDKEYFLYNQKILDQIMSTKNKSLSQFVRKLLSC